MPNDLLEYQQMSVSAKPVLRHHPPLTHNFTLLTLPGQQYSRANTQRKKGEKKLLEVTGTQRSWLSLLLYH